MLESEGFYLQDERRKKKEIVPHFVGVVYILRPLDQSQEMHRPPVEATLPF